MTNTLIAPPLANWIPYKLVRENGQWICKWLYTADVPFTDPFFDETILKCKSHPSNSRVFNCVSTLADLPAFSGSLPSVEPTAFIFHISRCGSTLLSQMLSLDPDIISLAEVPLIDRLLRLLHNEEAEDEQVAKEALKATIALHGQKRKGNEKHLFIKLDSWHIFFYDVLHQLYPNVPCILLYRSPDEVLRSHQKHRGMHGVPGVIHPDIFGLTEDEIGELGLDEYTAAVLERYLVKFSEVARHDGRVLLLNYNEGIMPIIKEVLSFAGVTTNDEVMAAMEARSRFHSKFPGKAYKPDEDRGALPDCLKDTMAAYHKLEGIRPRY